MKLTVQQLRRVILESTSEKALVRFKETREGGDIKPGMEDDNWPDHEDMYIDVDFEGVWLHSIVQGSNVTEVNVAEPMPRNAKKAYLVLARTTVSDTFSTTHGYWSGSDAWLYASEANADQRAKEITDESKHGSSWSKEYGEVHVVPIMDAK